MSNRKKGMKWTNVVLATTLATSVIAVTNPASAASQKESEKNVKQTKKDLKKRQKKFYIIIDAHK